MREEVLKNRLGVQVATIKKEHDKYVIYNKHSVRLGTFDPKTNLTKDQRNAIVGTGNWLTALL
ncbi:hypothetical protein [Enterococcus sp. CSURQ0835]|uniref:hypothetical protein n=1 Tax=Enterococcus sp. CSURQ0835 TaxID=2681394 RepID=UPI0013588379|nr:hypothetical protein [Enterococcus sp. CSURQ0835]